jgi:CUB/sushi domain-containing protein
MDPQYPTTAILGTVLLVPAQEHATTVECGQEVLQCVAKFCSCPPQIEYGFYSRCSGIIGDEISYTCRPGYSFIGNSSIHRRCSGGVWSGRSPTCRKITCGLLSQPTFGATVQYHTSNGSILALYECTSGYHLVGSSTRTCTSDDTWTGRAPTCIRNLCRCPPSPANGYTRECVDSGTVVSYHCISGYRLVGNNRRTCLSMGNDWSGSAPSCQKSKT